MTRYKNRPEVTPGDQVTAHLNLHRPGHFSVLRGGLVVAHVRTLTLIDARLHVNPNGRQRVLDTGRKNVHAWVAGRVAEYDPRPERPIRYNPRQTETFVDEHGQQILSAPVVTLRDGRAFIN